MNLLGIVSMEDTYSVQNEYNISTIRQLLSVAFNDEELTIFCYDYYPAVYKEFTTGMTFSAKVQLLVDYCNRMNLLADLLESVKKTNPNQYTVFSPLLKKITLTTATQLAEQSVIPTSTSPITIFLSYAREDQKMARRLAEELQRAGFAVWWDVSDLKPGVAWGRTIEAALRASQYCLVLLSPASVKSEWVEKEYMYALSLNLPVIPLLYQDCDRPLALFNKQYLDFRGQNYEWSLQKLLATLTEGKDHVSIVARPTLKQKLSVISSNFGWWMIGGLIGGCLILGVIVGWLATSGGMTSRLATQAAAAITPLTTKAPSASPTLAPPTPTSTVVIEPTTTPSSPTATTEPTASVALFAEPAGQIAFVSDRDGNQEIYVMNADGSKQTNLTNNNLGKEWGPAWSPDGRQIAFVSDRDGNEEIYVMNADGSGQTNLTKTSANDRLPVWSPDGSKIAFISHRDGQPEVYVMDSNGLRQKRLMNSSGYLDIILNSISWSPDSSRIVFFSDRDSTPTNWEIYVASADGSGQARRLTREPGRDETPAWSPDSERIAYVSNANGNADIYVINADGSGLTPLTSDPATDLAPLWSPDGKQIAFISDREGNEEIYVMNSDGSEQKRLSYSIKEWARTWSTDSRQIAYISNRDGNPEIYVMNSDGSRQTRLTTDPANDSSPAWRPFK